VVSGSVSANFSAVSLCERMGSGSSGSRVSELD
jgi:hypothetical protein